MRHPLYQPKILAHSQNPCYKTSIDTITHSSEGYNRNCGDYIKIEAYVTDNIIFDLAIHCECCAICKASASMLSKIVNGQPISYFKEKHKKFNAILFEDEDMSPETPEPLITFKGLNQFPTRQSCAQLPWQTLAAALKGIQSTSTDNE